MNLWEYDEPVSEFDIHVPAWIESDITCCDIAAIVQGGCASGAYMPAVTYYNANKVMATYGDDVLDYIQGQTGELPKPDDCESWSGMVVFYLSVAVELWAYSVETQLTDIELD